MEIRRTLKIKVEMKVYLKTNNNEDKSKHSDTNNKK